MRHSRKRQQGSALIIVMLVMAMMGIIGLAALEAVTRDQRVAGFMKRKKVAFFAAEAGVAAALHALRTTEEPTFAPSTVGDASWFVQGLPTYEMDTSGGPPSTNLGVGAMPGMNMQIGQNNTPKFTIRYWEVRVKGEAFGGTISRIAFAAGALEAN
ncbi:MAG TPA: PilX N-terminal domain-containing pilus assembly protein [Myxococcota bacterium]